MEENLRKRHLKRPQSKPRNNNIWSTGREGRTILLFLTSGLFVWKLTARLWVRLRMNPDWMTAKHCRSPQGAIHRTKTVAAEWLVRFELHTGRRSLHTPQASVESRISFGPWGKQNKTLMLLLCFLISGKMIWNFHINPSWTNKYLRLPSTVFMPKMIHDSI